MNTFIADEDKNKKSNCRLRASDPTPTADKKVRFNPVLEQGPTATTAPVAPIPFWSDNPNVLLNSSTMLEFYPVDSMTFAQKLNAITRTVLVTTIVFVCLSAHPLRIFFIALLCLTGIWGMYEYYRKPSREGMSSFSPTSVDDLGMLIDPASPPTSTSTSASVPVYQQPTPENPFSNILVSDYENHPHKLSAPPASNPMVNDLITQTAIQSIQDAHPGQPDIVNKLYHDIDEQLTFEQSMRPFYTNPGTTIPNDQGAFAQFCYGDMISCKEGNMFACGRNTGHYTNY